MEHQSLVAIATLTALLGSCGIPISDKGRVSETKEEWDISNDPRNLRDEYEVAWLKLPTEAELSKKPWTDSYWPSYQGGLAQRWYGTNAESAFSYPLISRDRLSAMSIEERQRLSPAEKYDAFLGRYDFPLVRFERQRTSPDDPTWFGLCHGWAPASLNFTEPKPVVTMGADGIEIPFGSSDIKALLTYAQQDGRRTRFLGNRCEFDLAENSQHADDLECRDANAGSFHIVIANEIGILNQGFIAEVNRGYQVWNHPVFGFQTEALEESESIYEGAAPGTVKVIKVRTVMSYISEISPAWEAMPFADYPQQYASQTLLYHLELNSQGEIIGGAWISANRPDFLWVQEAPHLNGYFSELARIYQASIR